jgi:hypothetical protein
VNEPINQTMSSLLTSVNRRRSGGGLHKPFIESHSDASPHELRSMKPLRSAAHFWSSPAFVQLN